MKKFMTVLIILGIGLSLINIILVINFFSILETL